MATDNTFDDHIHLLSAVIGDAVIRTACGAKMQGFGAEWTNEVNYAGRIGIRVEQPFTTVTLDPSKVTCRRTGCRQRSKWSNRKGRNERS